MSMFHSIIVNIFSENQSSIMYMKASAFRGKLEQLRDVLYQFLQFPGRAETWFRCNTLANFSFSFLFYLFIYLLIYECTRLITNHRCHIMIITK